MSNLKKTILNEVHKQAGALLVDFAGWEMPLHYGSQITEHHAVRKAAGIFDVSHMTISDLSGKDAQAYLLQLLANDVRRITKPGQAIYSCMLNDNGGVIDDLIVYWRTDKDRYRIITNAATRETDLAWMRQCLEGFNAELIEKPDMAMLAVQGPIARNAVLNWLPDSLRQKVAELERFCSVELPELNDIFVGRTGYTGEDGFELIIPQEHAVAFWQDMLGDGVTACGLGARDTLRLEAGMMLYGSDLDTVSTPLESALKWSVAMEHEGDDSRDFHGRKALEQQLETGTPRKIVGLRLKSGKGVMRSHQKLFIGDREVGCITSGGFSPTLNESIALARIATDVKGFCELDMRGKRVEVVIQRPVFVREGKAV